MSHRKVAYAFFFALKGSDEHYFSVNSFIEDMRAMQFHGTCQSAYCYVAACTTKWMNDQIMEFCKDAGLYAKGNVKGVRDMEIVDYLVENVQFFVLGVTPYYYDHGVYKEDYEGVRLKYRIQKLIYRDQIQSNVIKRIYNLLIAQPKVHRESYELNKQPVH